MIAPKGLWHKFEDDNEKLSYLRSVKLIPKTIGLRPIYYTGPYVSSATVCDVVGYVDAYTLVISVDGALHCIHPDRLCEMQSISVSEKYRINYIKTPKKSPLSFVAFDFETADYDNSAPCAIGMAVVKDGVIVDELSYLINPEVEFSPYTIEIHGITPESVQGAPTFPDVWDEIMPYFVNYPIVAHNAAFDINVLRKVCARYEIDFPEIECYCTMEIARKQLHEDSLKLTDLCSKYGIACECHHNARRDAAACANLMLCMLAQGIQIRPRFTSCKLEDNEDDEEDDCEYFGVVVAHRSKKPKARRRENIRPSDIHPSVEKFDESNPLYGKNIVFTGELSISRSEAMQIAVDSGAIVKSSVSRKTDYLVVGMQDIALVGDDGLSTKEEKAYMLNENGCAKIEFLNEAQFLALTKGGAYCGANDD